MPLEGRSVEYIWLDLSTGMNIWKHVAESWRQPHAHYIGVSNNVLEVLYTPLNQLQSPVLSARPEH